MDTEISLCVDNEVDITSVSDESIKAADCIADGIDSDEPVKEEDEGDVDDVESEEKRPGEHFIVSSIDEMRDVLDDYYERTNSHFVVQKKSKHFGLSALECDLLGHQVQWMDMQKKHGHYTDIIVQFDGVPHICVGNLYLNCQFGIDSSLSKKMKRKEMREKGELDNIKSRNLKTPSKKCGCPATIVVRQIIKFPEFKIEKDTEWRRRDGAGKLKARIRSDRESLVTEVVIIGRLPNASEHKYHEILEGHQYTKEVIHRDIILKAQELFLENKSHNEIRDSLHQYAINEKFSKGDEIDFNRRRFFPAMKDIHNIVGRFRPLCRFTPEEENDVKLFVNTIKQQYEKINIELEINDHNPNCSENVKIESSSDESVENEKETAKERRRKEKMTQTFICTFQTPRQQRLMRKYCQVAYIIEIQQVSPIRRTLTYRLYALIAQTNLDFQVIGCIIVSKQRNNGLTEGLKLLKEWNPCWNPKYFLVDCSQVIYDAVSSVFPDSNYLLNPSSCESKWMDVTSSPSNDLSENSEQVLSFLKNMQYALTEDALNVAAAYLEASEIWQNSEKLRTWFLTSWLPVAKMWVYGYRPEDLLITHHVKFTLNQGIQAYQDALTKATKQIRLVDVLENFIKVVSEKEYEKYEKSNNEQYQFFLTFQKSKYYSEFMHGIPISLVPYTEGICKLAEANDFTITCGNLGVFSVQANVEYELGELAEIIEIAETEYGSLEYPKLLDSREYTVSFGDSSSYPFCTCAQWLYYRIPCVHMFAIICNVPGWKFDMLSPLYRFNPVFDIDTSCIHHPINCVYEEKFTQVEEVAFKCAETQTEVDNKIFTFPFHNAGIEILNEQKKKTSKALFYLKDISYMFKSQSFYENMYKQMEELLIEIEKEIDLAREDLSMMKDWLPDDKFESTKNQSKIKNSLITAGTKNGLTKIPVLAPIGKCNNLEFLQQAIKKIEGNSIVNKLNDKNGIPINSPILIHTKNVTMQSGICENPIKAKIIPPLAMINKKRKFPSCGTNFKNIFKCDDENSPIFVKTSSSKENLPIGKEPSKDQDIKSNNLRNSELSVLSILPRMNKGGISEKSSTDPFDTSEMKTVEISSCESGENVTTESVTNENGEQILLIDDEMKTVEYTIDTSVSTVVTVATDSNHCRENVQHLASDTVKKICTKDSIDFLVCQENMESIENPDSYSNQNQLEEGCAKTKTVVLETDNKIGSNENVKMEIDVSAPTNSLVSTEDSEKVVSKPSFGENTISPEITEDSMDILVCNEPMESCDDDKVESDFLCNEKNI